MSCRVRHSAFPLFTNRKAIFLGRCMPRRSLLVAMLGVVTTHCVQTRHRLFCTLLGYSLCLPTHPFSPSATNYLFRGKDYIGEGFYQRKQASLKKECKKNK